MNKNRPNFISGAYRMTLIVGLLTIAAAGFFSLIRPAAMQTQARQMFDSTEQPNTLGKLAFQRLNFPTSGSGNISLHTVNPDGTGLTTVAAAGVPPLTNAEPAWSPDGTKIAYVQDFDIFVMNGDGSNKVNATNNSLNSLERNPSWSVTNKIAFERNSQIWTMNADGSNQAVFSAITQPTPLTPAWSPNGSKMAFASNGEIWVINADGTNERRVTNNATTDADPAWSPDGTKIIFGKGGSGIAVINLDGTGETNLTNGTTDSKPSWSSDGTKIAFVRRDGANGGIFTMDATGANPIRIVADQTTQPGRNENDNPAWQPVQSVPRRALFDFDGDGKADISVFRPNNGVWYRINSQDNSFAAVQFGASTDKLAPADYDGDFKTDIAVFRDGATAYFYILQSQTNTFRAEPFGTTGDIPKVGDFDGDGLADLAVYRGFFTIGSQSHFYYRPTAAPSVSYRAFTFGNGGIPLVGDFDGDGKTDPALFMPTGAWGIVRSSDNQYTQIAFGAQFDIPVPADYDADGKTDVAVFRPSNGTWYITTNPAPNFSSIQFGANGDVPVPADYDGDGRADVAVYRGGTWYLLRSQAGFTGIQFGAADDKPIPAAFMP